MVFLSIPDRPRESSREKIMTEGLLVQRLFSLNGKSALVTGASGGIGQVIAVSLAQAGADVAINGATTSKLDITRQSIEKAGGLAMLPSDLSGTDNCRNLISDVCSSLGGIDILVNCIGTNRRQPIEDVTARDFETLVNVNLRNVFFLCEAACTRMKERGGGKIVNIGSVTLQFGKPFRLRNNEICGCPTYQDHGRGVGQTQHPG
jgi:NAD(P)-dependent dehydrogenase (short-subunit alcohol dehydrogenase family)